MGWGYLKESDNQVDSVNINFERENQVFLFFYTMGSRGSQQDVTDHNDSMAEKTQGLSSWRCWG